MLLEKNGFFNETHCPEDEIENFFNFSMSTRRKHMLFALNI